MTVQGWSFWLAIAGMAISIVGFWITLVQLARTKRATSAVSDEIKRIRFAVSKYDATIETSRAETALQIARKHMKLSEWDRAGEALEDFSKSLHTLTELAVPEVTPHSADLEGVMAHTNRLCERLDRAGEAGLPDAEKTKTLSSMREHDRMITSVRIALERSNIGE